MGGNGAPPPQGGAAMSGRRGLPKLRELLRRQRGDSESVSDLAPDLDFDYADADKHLVEIAELYSYTEDREFFFNRKCFEACLQQKVGGDVGGESTTTTNWKELGEEKRSDVILFLLNATEVSDRDGRLETLRALLYLCQGVYGEVENEQEQSENALSNAYLFVRLGAIPVLVQLLDMEIENTSAANSALRKPAVSIADSADIRVILNIIYHIVETVWRIIVYAEENGREVSEEDQILIDLLRTELSHPDSSLETGENLCVTLFTMVTKFCSGAAPHFPMKKVLLVLWKIILFKLGGMKEQQKQREAMRLLHALPPVLEDSVEVVKNLRAASPPASAADLIEQQTNNASRRTSGTRGNLAGMRGMNNRAFNGGNGNGFANGIGGASLTTSDAAQQPMDEDGVDNSQPGLVNRQLSIDESGQEAPLAEAEKDEEEEDLERELELESVVATRAPLPNVDDTPAEVGDVELRHRTPSPMPRPDTPRLSGVANAKSLPWQPKVRQKDLENFLDQSRQKFVGYSVQGDQETMAGLPNPIHEGVGVLRQHIYTSLAEVQIQHEDDIAKYPLSKQTQDIFVDNAVETLYQSLLPNLPQYMIALLKILLAAAPTSKAKTDSINILADVLPEEMPTTVLQSMKLGIDVNRHKEIIVKAISAILLLLLKHFKVNHVYQFEFMSQHLVFANCIPLILKFFNQNIVSYISAKNGIAVLDFPACVIGDPPELTAEALDASSPGSTSPTTSSPGIAPAMTDSIILGSPAASVAGEGTNANSATCALTGSTNATGLYCWRNLFSCINLLRILNKLTKWKHSRTMMLVVFKSAPILKRALKVKQAMMQLYILKLLKVQTKYLGRQWRKSNMKTMSAIYQKVRHRLTDDWAYGNDMDARPWDFQAEECALRSNVDRFNTRRYANLLGSGGGGAGPGSITENCGSAAPSDSALTALGDPEFIPVDNSFLSVLGREVTLPNEFKDNYEHWLEREVFGSAIDWDCLLLPVKY